MAPSTKCPNLLSFITKYVSGFSFSARIVTLHYPERGIFSVIDDDRYEQFLIYKKYQPDPKDILTSVGFERMLYKKGDEVYRVFCVESNPGNRENCKVVLLDTGETNYLEVKPGVLYKYPQEFKRFRAMAITCIIGTLPAQCAPDTLQSDFLRESLGKSFRFTIQIEKRLPIIIAGSQRCLVVDIEYIEDKSLPPIVETHFDDSNVTKSNDGRDMNMSDKESTSNSDSEYSSDSSDSEDNNDEEAVNIRSPANFKTNLTYPEVPLTLDDISLCDEVPLPGSTIMIFPQDLVSSKQFYSRFLIGDDCTSTFFPKSTKLQIWMNDRRVVKRYRLFEKDPEVDELVIGIGEDNKNYRGVVESKKGFLSKVFFFDFGSTKILSMHDMYQFPAEFASLPMQTARLTIENMPEFNEASDSEVMEIVEAEMGSTAMAHVSSSRCINPQVLMSVKVHSFDGDELVETVVKRMTDPPEEFDETSRFYDSIFD